MSDNSSYQAPEFQKENFHCPFCGVHARHYWGGPSFFGDIGVFLSRCNNCEEFAFWKEEEGSGGEMVYPKVLLSPPAHEDMPESVKELYEEARGVSVGSSRAAAALLRCSLEKLVEYLGETEGTLNARIGNLVQKGLPPRVQEALDIVRITANEGGSHCGTIDLTGQDGREVVDKLFWLVNFVVEKVITEPNEIGDMFAQLPQDKADGVRNRDANGQI